jgi:hypothetical protein
MKILYRFLGVILTGLGCVATASNVRGDEILVNGGFEDEPNYPTWLPAIPFGGNAIPGWTILTTGTIHQLSGAGFPTDGFPTITGYYSLNTDGEGYGGMNCQIFQDFRTVNGGSYNFAFNWETWVVDAPLNFLRVSIEDLGSHTFVYNGLFDPTLVSDLTIQLASTSFLGDGDTYRLEIQQTPQSGFNDNEYIVDNFSVRVVPDVTTWSADCIATLACAALRFAMRRSTNLHPRTANYTRARQNQIPIS